MNSPLIRWLLDIDVIPQDAGTLRLAWEHPWPSWVWVILVFAAGFFAIWSYSGLVGNRKIRGALAAIRLAVVLLALILISGPMLELPRETVEEDWVLMLADRSASMTIADVSRAAAAGRDSRDAQLQAALERAEPMFNLLGVEREVVWMGFQGGAFNLETAERSTEGDQEPTPGDPTAIASQQQSTIPDLGPADGRRTNIEAALEQALQRAAARPVSGIVLLSDGRSDSQISRTLMRRLQADAIPVFVVPLGAEEPLGDLAVRDVDAPRRAFVHDKVPVVVDLERLGAAAADLSGVVRLIDEATGEELDRVDLADLKARRDAGGGGEDASDGADHDEITLTAEPKLAGETTWKVVIDTADADLVPDNNLKTFTIELVDRPLRVLYVEGYPRWEYRYVKELIRREKSVESSVMLISADRDFAQEGNMPITRLPRSSEEFAAYDVLIIGDVPAGFFSPDQLETMKAHVADRGAGLLWIGGERSTPASYSGSVLADLLPMRGSLNLAAVGTPVTLQPTPQAERLGVLQLASGETVGWPEELSDPATGWSRLLWAQRIEPGQLKPAVEVLGQTAQAVSGAVHLPMVLSMRYGAGQSIYVATDEIWRWRYGRGELYPDQFWMQMIRMLGRESLSASGSQAQIEISPRRVQSGQPMRLELRLLDAQLLQQAGPGVRVTLRDPATGAVVAEIDLKKVEGADDRYAATYLPDVTGQFEVRVNDPAFAALDLRAAVEVFAPDDELRRPETDHDLLRGLAESTNGKVLAPAQLGTLPSLLPNREVRTSNPLTEPIWDTPLMLILAIALLTAEWIGRKVVRLV
jgi:hypothetical protein